VGGGGFSAGAGAAVSAVVPALGRVIPRPRVAPSIAHPPGYLNVAAVRLTVQLACVCGVVGGKRKCVTRAPPQLWGGKDVFPRRTIVSGSRVDHPRVLLASNYIRDDLTRFPSQRRTLRSAQQDARNEQSPHDLHPAHKPEGTRQGPESRLESSATLKVVWATQMSI